MCIYRELLAPFDRSRTQQPTHLLTLLFVLLTYLLIRLPALFPLVWLGSASDHRSRTPTTTPFH